MRARVLSVLALLCLSVLGILPLNIIPVHAVLGSGNYWSAYGPRTDNLLYKVYNDFSGVFTDFNSGQLDITDWPIQPADLAGFINNPDFFVTPKIGNYGIFQLDMNHQDPFLSLGLQVPRSTTGGTNPATTGSPGFAPGTPSLTIISTCTLPCPGGALKRDPFIKFIDSPPATTPNAPGTWAQGKGVVYDIDNDGIYNAEGTPVDPVISGSGLPNGVNLSVDPKVKFIDDFPANSVWNRGEAVVYDANNNNFFDSGEPVIAGTSDHFSLVVNLKNIEEGGALIKDANNLVTATITGEIQPTATKSDDGNLSPSGTYTGIGLISIPPSYNISTTIYSGSATLFTSGSTPPVCLLGQQCTSDLRVNYNSASSQKPSVAGVEIGRALSHLVDKPSYLIGPYLTPAGGTPLATCDDVQVPSTQGLTMPFGAGACDHGSSVDPSTLSADCVEHADLFGTSGQIGGPSCSSVSLYNLKADSVGGASGCPAGTLGISCFPSQSASPPPTGYSGTLDLAAACENFVLAGFTLTGTTGTTMGQKCTSVAKGTGHVVNPNGSCNTSTGTGCIIFYIRTNEPRKAFGTIIADEVNLLFGTPAPNGGTICYGGPPSLGCSLTPIYFTISQVESIVFDVTTVADWNLYTGGFTLTSTPDHLYSLYHSHFASNICDPSATSSSQPNNYPLWCDPVYDTQARAGENVPGITLSGFSSAAILGATRGMTVSIYSGQDQFVALNAWNSQAGGIGSSLVTMKGHGFQAASGFLLNMHPVSGYAPANSLFYASGCNPATGCQQNIIRRSMAQTTLHLNPYTFTTAWEGEPLVQIYDTMLAVDPNAGGLCQTQPGGTAHCVDWMTTSHSTLFDIATGLTTQGWTLRSDINFHDGQAITAHDVCFTLLSYRDAPSANFFPNVSNVVSCKVVTDRIVQVVLTGQSPFNELNIGGVFILPEHVWGPLCGYSAATDQCAPASAPAPNVKSLVSTSFDPVAVGYMVGSGAWVCNPAIGVSTITGQASCTQNANGSAGGQAIAAGGRILLKRNLGYMRCCGDLQTPQNGLVTTNLQVLQWADFNKDGKVTIVDIATAATHFGSYDPYFASPLYGAKAFNATKPNGGLTVDIGDIATIAIYLDHGLTSPFLGTPNGYLSAAPPAGLTQVDPQTDPYDLTVLGVSDRVYGNGASSNWGQGTSGAVQVSGLVFVLQSNAAIPAGASYKATIVAAPTGAPRNPCTVSGRTFSDGTLGPVTLSFPSGTSSATSLQFNFGHCWPSGTYSLRVAYTPPLGSATTFWTMTLVKP